MKNYNVLSILLLCMSTACSSEPQSSMSITEDSDIMSSEDSSSFVTASALCEEQEIVCPQGEPGESGMQGPQGEPGSQGKPGAQGPRGDTGPAGPTGKSGMMGMTGPQGMQGQQGSQGPQGPKGSTGANGAKGDQGDPGQDGQDGAFDPSLLYVKSANELAANATTTTTQVKVECDAGDILMTGNCVTSTANASLRIAGMSLPGDTPEAWVCRWNHPQNVGFLGAASVRCLDVP